ncbi:MAG: hypothetical protein Q9190_004848 [Brigantiaea leucoxantha]
MPLQHTWKKSEKDELNMSHEQKTKILFQLGMVTWELSRLDFDQAGSLFEEDGKFQIKTCLSRGLLQDGRHLIEDLNRGPFKSEKDFYEAHVSAFLEHVQYLRLRHHCFFAPIPAQSEYDDYEGFRKASDLWSDFVTVQSKIDGSDNRTDYVIAQEILSEMVSRCTNDVSKFSLNERKHRFPIYHPDFSVDNIFVDEDFNITCIIDWAFCSSVPLSMLLMAPGLPQSRYEIDESLLPAFEDGFRYALQKTSQPENIETEMTLYRMLSCSRPMWLLSRILNLDTTTDYHLFKALWDSMKIQDQDISEFFRSRQSSEQYMLLHSDLKEEEQTTEQIDRSEKRYFRGETLRLAIARKLTLVSQWSLRYDKSMANGIRGNGDVFVADKKLWAWIDNCVKV